MDESSQDNTLIGWAVDIVSSYISNNSLPASELPGLLHAVHASLSKVVEQPEEEVKAPPTPPVPIRKSIADDYLICLEDGKRFKSLKRHLHTVHGMSPEQYRERWGLGRDYPMVAPDYAKARSALAKGMGLGASRRPSAVLELDQESEEPADSEEAVPVADVDPAPEADPVEPEPDVPAEAAAKPKRVRQKKA